MPNAEARPGDVVSFNDYPRLREFFKDAGFISSEKEFKEHELHLPDLGGTQE